jgi:hypothetical protein
MIFPRPVRRARTARLESELGHQRRVIHVGPFSSLASARKPQSGCATL